MMSVSGCAGVEMLVVEVLRGVALRPVPGVMLRLLRPFPGVRLLGVFLDLGVVRGYGVVLG